MGWDEAGVIPPRGIWVEERVCHWTAHRLFLRTAIGHRDGNLPPRPHDADDLYSHPTGGTMHRRRARFFAALLPMLAGPGLISGTAHAAGPAYSSTTRYAAMGDSYSAGLGAPDYSLNCGRSPHGYPTLWATAHGITGFTDVTCSGAVTDDVLAKQVPALAPQTDVVTITIGGNDVGLGNQVSTCLTGGDQACTQAVQQMETDLPTYMAKIDKTYAAIRQAAPHAQVYVLGYPHLFETTTLCFDLISPNQTQRKELNAGNDVLNQNLAQQAARAGFHFVDVRQKFAGHSDCSLSSWLNPILSLPGPLHPTADGYKLGYLAALNAATG
jgi:lysophospholipase L1-like esterase